MQTNTLTWRDAIIASLDNLFAPSDRAHGRIHAENVEAVAIQLAQQPEFADMQLDMDTLRAAALLHDIGYSAYNPRWSPDRGEHIVEGAKIARKILAELRPFANDERRVDEIIYLILNHDRTNYSFPLMTKDGRVVDPVHGKEYNWSSADIRFDINTEDSSLQAMLAILKDADSKSGTGSDGAKRTLDYSLSRSVPGFATGNRLNAWAWEESAVGNVRIAAKRALLDSYTSFSRNLGFEGYKDAEELIQSFCRKNGVRYEQEMAWNSWEAAGGNDEMPTIHKYDAWGYLLSAFQNVRLHGDSSLFPYSAASFESTLVDIQRLAPLSQYVLGGQVELHNKLRRFFLRKYALDPLDLAGAIDFDWKSIRYRMSPPIIEVYTEENPESVLKGEVWALVDGLHRCYLAKKLGLEQIRVIVIRGIPKHFPLAPLPNQWDDVREVEKVPGHLEKRRFRYPTLESLPDISQLTDIKPATDQDARYFFYRDLAPLGSTGIRQSPAEIPVLQRSNQANVP